MTLSFDITRRCNQNCDFCAKGEQQNQDITQNIVDKTFDEVEYIAIDTLRLFGGEPFLNPEMTCYILEQVINRSIMVGKISINTNGTILNDAIRSSLKKCARYLSSIKEQRAKIFGDWCHNNGIVIDVSTIGHTISKDQANKAVLFYNQIDELNFTCEQDSMDNTADISNICITLQGNAEKNHSKLLTNPLNLADIRIRNNKYNFVYNFNYGDNTLFRFDTYIAKTVSVSTDGSVYIGCSAPWRNIDSERLFNIIDCKRDLIKRIDKYCWLHPVNEKIRDIREKAAAIEWCESHAYKINGVSVDIANSLANLVILTNEHERIAKQIHDIMPQLNHNEAEDIAAASFIMMLQKCGASVDNIKLYMSECTNLDKSLIENYKPELIENYYHNGLENAQNRIIGNLSSLMFSIASALNSL